MLCIMAFGVYGCFRIGVAMDSCKCLGISVHNWKQLLMPKDVCR